MKEQTSIPKHKLGRAASLAGAGMKVGVNYLRYKGTKALTGRDEKDKFHERTAADTYKIFSKLKGGPLKLAQILSCLLYTSPSPRDATLSRMPSSA